MAAFIARFHLESHLLRIHNAFTTRVARFQMKKNVCRADEALVRVFAFDVGHGDAIAVDWQDRDARWTCLVDGGSDGGPVADALRQHGIDHLDLVIASHLDTDHVSGLLDVVAKMPVGEYWGPSLPAFTRHRWLFGTRCQAALDRGSRLESVLEGAGIEIVYPLEGYRSAPGAWQDR